MKFRLFNFRIIFFSAAFFVVGIILVPLTFFNKILFGCVFLGTTAALLVALIVVRHKSLSAKLVAILAAALIFFNLGGGLVLVRYAVWQNGEVKAGEHTISGTVVTGVAFEDGTLTATIKNLTIDGKKMSGKARLTLAQLDKSPLEFASVGDKITIKASLQNAKFFDNGLITGTAASGIRYFVNAMGVEGELENGNTPFFEILRQRIYTACYAALGQNEGAVAAGMILGGSVGIDQTTAYYFSVSGITHILSVSGLHISFIAIAIMFVLDKIKIKRFVKTLILTGILIFYLGICNFVLPAVRSVIMAVMASFALTVGERSDSLTNLSFATIILLLINPLYLFDLSFQLSFLATLGIISLDRVFLMLMKKIPLVKKCNDKILGGISVTIAAQTGVVGLSMITMQRVSLYSVLANFLIVPILNIGFVFMFAASFVCLVFPFMYFLMMPAYPFLIVSRFLAGVITKLPFSQIVAYSAGFMLIFYFAALVLSSKFSLLDKLPKRITTSVLCLICVLMILPANIASRPSNDVFACVQTNIGLVDYFSLKEGKTCLVGDFRNLDNVSDFLRRNKIRKIEGILLTNTSDYALKNANSLILQYGIKTVYVPPVVNMKLSLINDDRDFVFLENGFAHSEEAMEITVYYSEGGAFLGFVLVAKEQSFLQLNSTSQDFLTSLHQKSYDFSVIHSYAYSQSYPNAQYFYTTLPYDYNNSKFYSGLDFTLSLTNGRIL